MEFQEFLSPEQIRVECWKIQQSWTDEQRAARSGCLQHEDQAATVKQFLVHHRGRGGWVRGAVRSVAVWGCVDGR
jgi:hypothetical protein